MGLHGRICAAQGNSDNSSRLFWVLSFHFWATRCNIIIIIKKKNSRWETWPWKVTTHPITGALILTWRRRLVFFTGDQIVDERTLRTGMVYKRHSGGICQLHFSSEILQKIAGTLTIGWWYKLFSKPMKPYFTTNIFTINIVRIILTKLSNTYAWRNLNFLKKFNIPPSKT